MRRFTRAAFRRERERILASIDVVRNETIQPDAVESEKPSVPTKTTPAATPRSVYSSRSTRHDRPVVLPPLAVRAPAALPTAVHDPPSPRYLSLPLAVVSRSVSRLPCPCREPFGLNIIGGRRWHARGQRCRLVRGAAPLHRAGGSISRPTMLTSTPAEQPADQRIVVGMQNRWTLGGCGIVHAIARLSRRRQTANMARLRG